jgi:hypothetical protein
MRELAKSMVGFSWAVGLFGFQQVTKAMSAAAAPEEQTVAELDDVARAAEKHLDEPFARQFHAGDEWQRRMVDALFDAASFRSFDPRAMANSFDPRQMMEGVDPRTVIQSGVDMMGKGVDMLRQAATAVNPAASANAPSEG